MTKSPAGLFIHDPYVLCMAKMQVTCREVINDDLGGLKIFVCSVDECDSNTANYGQFLTASKEGIA